MDAFSVQVAQFRTIETLRSRGPVLGAIARQAITAASPELTATNLADDRQADLTVHSGPDIAETRCSSSLLIRSASW